MSGLHLDALLADVGLEAPPWSGAWPLVTGVACDSRRVQPGDLFVAIVGDRFDGRRFVSAALEAGAVAVIGPSPETVPTRDTPVPWVEVAEPRRFLGALSSRAFGTPGQVLRMVGITGTNGKSTLVHLMGAMLDAADEPSARLGTLGYFYGGGEWRAGGRTTPEAPDLHRILAGMLDVGARAAAMEVSSHALELGRVDDLLFDLAAFTNLSRDHLDFHGDLESYFAAKRRLFDQLKPGGTAVVHLDTGRWEDAGQPGMADDAPNWGHRLAADLGGHGVPCLTCGLTDEAQVRPVEVHLDLEGIDVRLHTPDGDLTLRSPLLGRFHLLNLVTAAACGVALGFERGVIENGLGAVSVVPGRLEPVEGPLPAFVDYSHTPAALEAALRSLRELSDRPIVVVFGCGGERDKGKRPQMGYAAGAFADLAVLTSDNPRREDPQSIMADAEVGLRQSGAADWILEVDRRRAIEVAARKARELGAVLLVAGRGHEETQDVGDRTLPFDDRDEVRLALARLDSQARPGSPADPGRLEVHHG